MRGRPFVHRDFRGGINTVAQPYALSDNEARDARNVVSTARGAIRKRNGSTTFSTPAGTPHSLYADDVTATKYLIAGYVASSTGKLASIDTGGTATEIGTGFSTTARWEWIQAPVSPTGSFGPLYGVNGVSTPQYWTGATAGTATAAWTNNAAGAIPNGKYVKYFKNRVWMAGMSANPSRLQFSNLGDPRDWPAANVVDFDPNDGDVITGLGTVGPYLLVFKQRKTFLVYDLDTGANRPIGDNIGCIAHRSIKETPQGTFFLTLDQGVYKTDGNNVTRLSQNISPTVESIIEGQRLNAAAAYWNDHYYLSVCTTGSTPNLTLDYDLTLGSWWFHTLTANQWAILRPTADPVLYGAGPAGTVTRAFQPGQTQDYSGVNYTAYWRSAFHGFGANAVNKRVRSVQFEGIGTINLSVAKNFAEGYALFKTVNLAGAGSTFGGTGNYGGEGTFGDPSSIKQSEACSLGLGKTFSVEVLNSTNAAMEVDSLTYLVNPPRRS